MYLRVLKRSILLLEEQYDRKKKRGVQKCLGSIPIWTSTISDDLKRTLRDEQRAVLENFLDERRKQQRPLILRTTACNMLQYINDFGEHYQRK